MSVKPDEVERLRAERDSWKACVRQQERDAYDAANSLDVAELDARWGQACLERDAALAEARRMGIQDAILRDVLRPCRDDADLVATAMRTVVELREANRQLRECFEALRGIGDGLDVPESVPNTVSGNVVWSIGLLKARIAELDEANARGVLARLDDGAGDLRTIEAQEARIAALEGALREYAVYVGPACEHGHRDDCPGEDCAGRPIDDAVNDALSGCNAHQDEPKCRLPGRGGQGLCGRPVTHTLKNGRPVCDNHMRRYALTVGHGSCCPSPAEEAALERIAVLESALRATTQRLETIRETHPTIALDRDIVSARAALASPPAPASEEPTR